MAISAKDRATLTEKHGIPEGYTEEFFDDVETFLEALRESGVTNMLGAGPYIEAEFGTSRAVSKDLLKAWYSSL